MSLVPRDMGPRAKPKVEGLSTITLPEWEAILEFLRVRSFHRIYAMVGGAGVVFAAWYLYYRLTRENDDRSPSRLKITASAPRIKETQSMNNSVIVDQSILSTDVSHVEKRVVIHCCPRGFYVPSTATEPLKLETYLRVANIPYEVNFCNEYDSPLLTYGGKAANVFRDCVHILADNFVTNLEKKGTSSSRKTASHLVDISLENHFSWAILIWRWIYDGGRSMSKIHQINSLGHEVGPEVALKVRQATKFHPIGQLSEAELVETIAQGIHDVSAALGKHKYFQGETPGTVDCHAFAIFAQILWNMPGCPFVSMLKRYSNLVDFVRRMKENYWPDWNELILKPDEFDEMFSALMKSNRSNKEPAKKPAAKSPGKTDQTKSTNNGRYKLTPTSKLPDPDTVTVIAGRKERDQGPVSVEQTPTESDVLPVGILKSTNSINENGNTDKPKQGGLISASRGSTKVAAENRSTTPSQSATEKLQEEDSATSTKIPSPVVASKPPTASISKNAQDKAKQTKSNIPCLQSSATKSTGNNTDANLLCPVPSSPVNRQPKSDPSHNLLCPPPQKSVEPSNEELLNQVQKPSVKFANPSAVDSTLINQQQPGLYNLTLNQQASNGNVRQLSELKPGERLRSQTSEYKRLQDSEKSQFHGSMVQHTVYGQPHYQNQQLHPMYNPGQLQPHVQYSQMQYPTVQQAGLNQEQMIKAAAQAHLDAHYRHVHYPNAPNQQMPRQYPSYHTGQPIIPSYVPGYEPMSPNAQLLRF